LGWLMVFPRRDQRVQQQTQRVDEKVTLLAFDQLARIKPMGVNLCPPFSARWD
jgi:hypothetical protein